MAFYCLQQSRPAKKEYKQLHTTPEKPVRRIFRLTDSGDTDNLAGQNTEPRNNSIQKDVNPANQAGDCSGQRVSLVRNSPEQNSTSAPDNSSVDNSNQKKEPNEESTIRELKATLPRFGPSYGEDTEAIKAAKDDAWKNVVTKTTGEQSTTVGTYLSAIRSIEKEARETYAPDIGKRLKNSEFQWMMIKDGCFFLQLALYILGGCKLLGFPEKHVYFGRRGDKEIPDKEISRWMEAMFFVGNQIPSVVIRELMKQSFFQAVIRKGIKEKTWSLPSDLPKMVLYLLVVAPELKRNSLSSSGLFFKLIWQKKAPHFREPPSDLLHGFHCLALGPGNYALECETADALDLEAGTQDPDGDIKFPSARELEKSGIKLRKAKKGIREIHFSRFLFFARLYVPPLTIDSDTELMLQYLKCYERQLEKDDREVTAYLRFMKDLIRTQTDFKILESKGIVEVKNMNPKNNPVKMLNRLVPSKEIPYTLNLRQTRLQITEYSGPPWHLLSLALILTMVQTVFTILSYFLPRN